MKILSVDQIREADKYTIANEPITSLDLMERAAQACTDWLVKKLSKEHEVQVFAGPGNNGGDGLAIARQLHERNFAVQVVLPQISTQLSEDCQSNLLRLKAIGVKVMEVELESGFPCHQESVVIVDALFGSGLSRPAEGLAAKAISYINDSQGIVVSIDIPSGLFADAPNLVGKDAIVQADYTLSLELAKHSFMFAENEMFLGDLHILPIDLDPSFIQNTPSVGQLITQEGANLLLHTRSKHAHKGILGHALLVAGSYTKMGAAVMAAQSALRSGLGLLTLHIPKHANTIVQTSVPEAMLSMDEDMCFFTTLPKEISNYRAIGVGPGLGTESQSVNAFKLLIQESRVPMVIDADALNMLAANKTFLAFLPQGSVLTPHPGEFERLVGKCANGFERITRLQELAQKFRLVVVLKGANTAVAGPDGQLLYNSTGNPGMATGGSGDVLTGIILALITQGYTTFIAAVLGVFLHGRAGDLALENESVESLIATDITKNLGKAFDSIRGL